MANIIIKSDERREAEQYVASQFHIGGGMSAEQRDAVETINARADEAREIAHRNEGRIVR